MVPFDMRRSIVVALLVASTIAVVAKGQTVRLEISGPAFAQPVETIEPKALANVWGGAFIGVAVAEPDVRLPRYRITFYVLPPREEEPRAMYVVTYVRDPQSGQGFV